MGRAERQESLGRRNGGVDDGPLTRALAAAIDATGHAVAVLAPDGSTEYVTPTGRELLARFGVQAWHLADGRDPVAQRDGKRLRARRVREPDGLVVVVLEERRATYPPLTRREHDVLSHVRNGLTSGEIAARLYLSPRTVERHLRNAYAKLGVHTRTAAVARVFDAP
ncbi:MAG TPA: helix-turn-helix transcriptional regulator [Gaiellaceae bacterium]|nr:helix-turn-helix transcriptional regulator [Gaiellaceae bacterium]